jgi:hypothetical protein
MTPFARFLISEDDKIVTSPVLTTLQKKRYCGAGKIPPGEWIAKKNPVIRTHPGNITIPGNTELAYNPGIRIAKGA